jgi:TolA-binding protein
MNTFIHKKFALAAGIVLVLISGCSQQEPMSVKMSRIVAAENMKLKEDLMHQDLEIESLKEQYEQQVKDLEEEIAELKEQIKVWEEKSRQNVRDQVESVLDTVVEQNAELRIENKQLREDIEKLKAELGGEDEPQENQEPVTEVPL